MNIRLVEAELFHVDRRMDVQTYMTKLRVYFRNFSKALKSDNKIPTLASQPTKSSLSLWEKGVIEGAGDRMCRVSTMVLLMIPTSCSTWRCVRLLVYR
jgi:hypothetical protein